MTMPGEGRRARRARLAVYGLMLALAACGGGGGGGDGAPAPAPAPVPVPPPPPPPPAGLTLQAHLAACPSTLSLNSTMACMVGLYEGTTTDTGAYCAFRYDAEAVSYYLAGGRTLRVGLSLVNAGSVFEKKAASNAAGFSLTFSVGIASGSDMDLSYQAAAEPASANGLLVKPKQAGIPACLVTNAPASAATASASTANLLGRQWQAASLLNGSSGALGVVASDLAFDAGMADDGSAVVAFRQPDGAGRMAVQVVTGRPGGAGESPTWTAPQVLDAAAPLVAAALRPRVAVSSNGHAVVAWFADLPCGPDSYESSPAGKQCRTLVASRKLAGESTWEAPVVVATAPPQTVQDHIVRINAAGDVVLAYPGFYRLGTTTVFVGTMLGVRNAGEAGYRVVRLFSFRSNYMAITTPLAQTLHMALDDDGGLVLAGASANLFSEVTWAHADARTLTGELRSDTAVALGAHAYEMQGSGGFAAYTWRASSGPWRPAQPERLSVYSPQAGAWLPALTLDAYSMWGDATLVGTAGGEFLLYAGCKVTAWRAGGWGATQGLPAYCGRDRAGGLYAFNRDGDYLGLHWAGKPGQWGYYSRTQNRQLKGAPGDGSAAPADLLLGTASALFGPDTTQLFLAPGGLALAVSANAYATLPSASDANGVPSANGSLRLWGLYLK